MHLSIKLFCWLDVYRSVKVNYIYISSININFKIRTYEPSNPPSFTLQFLSQKSSDAQQQRNWNTWLLSKGARLSKLEIYQEPRRKVIARQVTCVFLTPTPVRCPISRQFLALHILMLSMVGNLNVITNRTLGFTLNFPIQMWAKLNVMVDDCCLETEIWQSSLRLPIGNTLPFWRKFFREDRGKRKETSFFKVFF